MKRVGLKRQQAITGSVLFWVGALAISVGPALAQKKEVIQLQRDMAILQEQVRQMGRQMDGHGERMAVLENLLKQNLDTANKMNQAVALIERSIAKQADAVVAPVTSISNRVESLSSQFGALRDAVEEQSSRLGKIQQQVEDINNHLTALPPAGNGDEGDITTTGSSASTLYDSAMIDNSRGNWDLARDQFKQYLDLYPNSVRAAEAQYYLGDISYNQKNYPEAVQHFDTVLERYAPGHISPDAQYKKGLALIELNKPQDAIRELEGLVENYPNSNVVALAKERVAALKTGTP
jgi:tol-pal system protein YbgF